MAKKKEKSSILPIIITFILLITGIKLYNIFNVPTAQNAIVPFLTISPRHESIGLLPCIGYVANNAGLIAKYNVILNILPSNPQVILPIAPIKNIPPTQTVCKLTSNGA